MKMNAMTGRKSCMRTMALLPALALLGCLGGDNGKDGVNSTIRTTVEPAGEHCANGGIKIEVMQDGLVQEGETQYICNGNNGSDGSGSTPGNNGTSASVRTAAEPAGEHCANGGIKIEVLLDGEVQDGQTQYICNGIDGTVGTNGTNATIQTAPEPAGTNCGNGGIKIEVLADGVVQTEQTQYICNGEDGQSGANGSSASIRTSTVAVGSQQCANGGIKIEVLLNNVVQAGQTKYICNGTNGIDGRDGCDAGQYRKSSGECVSIPSGFVFIPAGSFVLSHETDTHASGDAVELNPFLLGKTPVSVEQFGKCVAAGACAAANYKTVSGRSSCNYNRGEAWLNHPMNCVYWKGAKEYCEWIGGRLPTEEEWEYASTHNGTEHLNTTYAFGNTLAHCVTANYFDGDNSSNSTKYCDGTREVVSYVGTAAIGTYSPAGDSPLGLVDMTGNVNEWTSSQFTASNYNKVLKGGGWGERDEFMPVTARITFDQGSGESYGGIRCVMEP